MILPFGNMTPRLHESVFVAQGAVIVGDVEIGRESSVWFNAVVRGDVNSIRIGERTNVQDGCVLHVTGNRYALYIGSEVTLGHLAIVHGARIHDRCLVGMGAKILDNATVGPYALVAAGALVREGSVVPEGTLVAGVPARVVRKLSAEERRSIEEAADHYVAYVRMYQTSQRGDV